MAEDEVLMEVIVNECDEVQFYSAADQCKILCEDNDAMLRTIKEAVKEGLLVLPSIQWNEIQSVRFTSKIEKSVEISTQEVLHETEYVPYEMVEEAPVDEAVMSSEVPEEIIIDVGLSSGKELSCELATANEVLEGINFIDERLNLCPYCDYRTYNVGHFKVHMRQHTGEAPFACEYCPYRSKQKSNLKRHLKQHLEGKDNFECEMCSFTCTKEKVYKRHLKLHQRSRPLRPCPFCDYFSSSLAHLTVHIRQHTGETPYHCGVCQYKTVQKSNLTRHLKKHRHHRVSKADKLRVCAHCNYRTPNSAHLLAHIRAAHTGEAPYSCKHCDYKSAQRSNLKRHMRKHTGERPFTCHLCDYSTAYAYVLKKHIDNHSDQDEKFKCDSCDYFTNSSLEFKRHMKIHSGRPMYCCHYCGYITLNGDHFKVHLRRHTKEAPFKCHHCDYSAAQRSNLKRHIQTHTEKNKENRDVASYNERRNVMEPEIEMSEGEADNEVDNSHGLSENVISENVPVIDTTQLQTENVEIYASEETYVEAPYSPTEGDLHEETVVATVNETSMEIVNEEHVVTTQYEGEEYEVYDDSGKIYLCSYCSYQSSSAEDIEGHMQEHEGKLYFKCQFCDYRSATKSNVSRHMQKHLGDLVNGVDNAVETDNPESDIAKANISFLNKSQTEKLKEFKRLLQEGTTSNAQNMTQVTKFPEHNISSETINRYPGIRNNVHSAEEYRVAESLQNGLNILDNEAVYKNQPSPEEVTLYGEIEEANFHEGIIEEEVISKDSSVLIVGTSKELESDHDCELCGFHARTIWELKSHIRVHTGEMSYVCPQCPFKTNQKNSFYRHVRHLHARRGNRIPYQCKLCDFKVKNREIFNKHLQTHSKKTTPSIECEICEQVMGSLAELKGHMKVHIGEAPYECFYCGKLTARKLHMRRHMKKHICTLEGKGPPFECDSCGYQTVYKTNYLRHLETHELDPPKALICHYCRFVTLDSKVFKQHLVEHRNPDRLEMLKDKLSQCPFCDYNTYNHGHFLVHLRQHTGIAPYSCHLCPYRSAQRSNLKRHTKFKHNRLGELDDLLLSDGTESNNDNSQNNNGLPEISNHRRKPLREQNTSLQNGKSNKSNIVKHLLKHEKDSNSMKLKNQEILNTISLKGKKSVKKREYIRRLGNVSESELRIRRRLDFNIKKVPKEPKDGFNVELRGEILKSKRQLREFNDFGKIIKRSDLDLSTVIEKESNIEAMFAPLRESIQALKELKNSGENVVTFTIYFKTKDERDITDIDNMTDIEAELLTDSNESDGDSIKIDDELSSAIMSDNDKNGAVKDIKSSKKELSHSDNGISSSNQIPSRKNFPLSFSIDRIKFFQNKIKERNEKMKQIRRQKVLRNSYALNKNSAKTDSSSSKKCVQVEYSYDNVEMEEVVIDHSIDALPSLV